MYEQPVLARSDGGPVIGLVLGSGAARGWSHIGVLDALAAEGVKPDIVCGSSIGALVGAAYVSGKLEPLGNWVRSLDWQDVVAMLDISLKGGLIRGDRVVQHCAQNFFVPTFSETSQPFACVATELSTGREIWLRDGTMADAVRASIGLPGLFSPVLRGGRVLVDGGLVNPVPVSLARAMGADLVIAVELGSGVVGRTLRKNHASGFELMPDNGWVRKLLATVGLGADSAKLGDGSDMPSLADVVTTSINIMQMRIARSRMAGEPADLLISPRVAHLNMMEFDRAEDAIKEGVAAVKRVKPLLHQLLGRE